LRVGKLLNTLVALAMVLGAAPVRVEVCLWDNFRCASHEREVCQSRM